MRYLLLLFAVFVIVACETATPEPPSPTPTSAPTTTPTATLTPTPSNTPPFIPRTNALEPEQQAFLRLIHAVPDLEAVDIYVEARAMAFNLGYGLFTQSTGIEAGDYILRVQPAGTQLHAVTPYIEQTITVAGGDSLALLLTGTPETPEVLAFLESDAPLDANQSRINVIHAYPGGPQITLQQNGADLTNPLDYGQLSNPVILPSELVRLLVQSGEQPLYNLTEDLRERVNYHLIVIPDPDTAESVTIISFSNRVPGRSQLRFVNGLQEPVDLYLNGEPFAEAIGAGQASERQVLPANTYIAEVYPAGTTDETPITSLQFNANQDDTTALILVGTPQDSRLIRHDEDISPVPAGEARIAFANGLPSSRGVRVELAGGVVPGIPDLNFGYSSPPSLLRAGTRTFYWSIYQGNTQGDTVEVGENIALEPGWHYLYLMRGGSPLVIAEMVGEDATLLAGSESGPTPIPIDPFRIRFVNALNQPILIDLLLDGLIVASGLNNGQVSEQTVFLEASPPDGSSLLATITGMPETAITSETYTFTEGLNYTVYVFGETTESAEFLVVQNPIYTSNEQFGNIRLVNTAADTSAEFRLAYRDAAIPIATLQPSGTPESNELPRFRTAMQAGMNRLTDTVSAGTTSFASSIPVGLQDLFVVDTDDVLIAATIADFTIEANIQYDVIVFQNRTSEQVSAYVIAYPVP